MAVRKTPFEKSVRRNGYCCQYAFWQDHVSTSPEGLADILDVSVSSVHAHKRKYADGLTRCAGEEACALPVPP